MLSHKSAETPDPESRVFKDEKSALQTSTVPAELPFFLKEKCLLTSLVLESSVIKLCLKSILHPSLLGQLFDSFVDS